MYTLFGIYVQTQRDILLCVENRKHKEHYGVPTMNDEAILVFLTPRDLYAVQHLQTLRSSCSPYVTDKWMCYPAVVLQTFPAALQTAGYLLSWLPPTSSGGKYYVTKQ
jgi:hypothetical protein